MPHLFYCFCTFCRQFTWSTTRSLNSYAVLLIVQGGYVCDYNSTVLKREFQTFDNTATWRNTSIMLLNCARFIVHSVIARCFVYKWVILVARPSCYSFPFLPVGSHLPPSVHILCLACSLFTQSSLLIVIFPSSHGLAVSSPLPPCVVMDTGESLAVEWVTMFLRDDRRDQGNQRQHPLAIWPGHVVVRCTRRTINVIQSPVVPQNQLRKFDQIKDHQGRSGSLRS